MAIITITGADWNRQGITREVLLTKRFAIKIPKVIYGWHKFLCGLLANMQEAQWGESKLDGLCPVVFACRGGWLLVMRRALPLTDEEWRNFNPRKFCRRSGYVIPAEFKRDSFGTINGEIVAIDYGN